MQGVEVTNIELKKQFLIFLHFSLIFLFHYKKPVFETN